MSRELYASLSGATSAWRRLENLSHNVSNASTTGFKEFQLTVEADGTGDGVLSKIYATVVGEGPAMHDGPLEYDGNPHHLALRGEGFFAVQTPEGVRMTRSGEFTPNAEGYLVTPEGYPLLGSGGQIQIPENETLTIGAEGRLIGSKTGELDTLRIVTGSDPTSLGGALWDPGKTMTEIEPREIIQGALESSNVDPLAAMVELVEATRFFEIQQRAMKASDDLDTRLNRLGGGK